MVRPGLRVGCGDVPVRQGGLEQRRAHRLGAALVMCPRPARSAEENLAGTSPVKLIVTNVTRRIQFHPLYPGS